MLDSEWWEIRWPPGEWQAILKSAAESTLELRVIREATYTGRPLGSAQFVRGLEERLGRKLEPRKGGLPERKLDSGANQMELWSEE